MSGDAFKVKQQSVVFRKSEHISDLVFRMDSKADIKQIER